MRSLNAWAGDVEPEGAAYSRHRWNTEGNGDVGVVCDGDDGMLPPYFLRGTFLQCLGRIQLLGKFGACHGLEDTMTSVSCTVLRDWDAHPAVKLAGNFK